MQQQKITGNTEEEIWQEIDAQFILNPDPLDYTAIIQQGQKQIVLDIDIDLGGGFESGYETTTFSAKLSVSPDFRFAIHQQGFTDQLGKFFGMEDVIIGYPELDERLIVKTNDRLKIKKVFEDATLRILFTNLKDFTFGVTHHSTDADKDASFLELRIETGITDPRELRKLYHGFFTVLVKLDDDVHSY